MPEFCQPMGWHWLTSWKRLKNLAQRFTNRVFVFFNNTIKMLYRLEKVYLSLLYYSFIRRVVRAFGRTIGRLGEESSCKVGRSRIPRISHKNGTFPTFALSRDRLRSHVYPSNTEYQTQGHETRRFSQHVFGKVEFITTISKYEKKKKI